jgi:dienelactone hydrolase
MKGSAYIELTKVHIDAGKTRLQGELGLPRVRNAVVALVQRSGSGQTRERNQRLAECLNLSGFVTLTVDLLAPREQKIDEATRRLRFDIPLLSGRLCATVEWVRRRPEMKELPIGLFGGGADAAAALATAARRPNAIGAVVSLGGRPDLAQDVLPRVHAPTLLILGDENRRAMHLNQMAGRLLRAHHQTIVIRGATHLFDGPGELDEVAVLSRDWFLSHLERSA